MKAFMKKYKHMEQEQEWWTLADAIERGEQRNKALLQEEYREGKEQGIKEGKTLTQQKILKSQIELKFKVTVMSLINSHSISTFYLILNHPYKI